jgi:hypothetical protein
MGKLPANSLKLYIGSEIKIGRRVFTINASMFILDNASCYQLCRRDGEHFYYENYTGYTNIVIPKKLVKAIDFSLLKQVPYNSTSKGIDYANYKAYKFKTQ